MLGCEGRCEKVCWDVGEGAGVWEVSEEVCWNFSCIPHTFPHLFSPPPHPNSLSHTFLNSFPHLP